MGKVAVITGASTGIGLQTAIALSSNPDYSRIVLACRNKEKTQLALSAVPNSEKYLIAHLDLSSLDSVDNFVAQLKKQGIAQIDRLVLNAGINDYTVPSERKTADGFDEIWQVNYLSHFYLSACILPLMRRSEARVVALSSFMHWFGSPSRFGQAGKPTWEKSKLNYYSDSKLAMAVMASELSRRKIVQALAVNPGSVGSDIFRTWFQGKFGAFIRRVFNAFLLSCEDGCKTSVYACTKESAANFEYLSPYGQIRGWGTLAACMSDMYWFWPSRNPSKFLGQCSHDVTDARSGELLWDVSTRAIAGTSEARQGIMAGFLH